MTHKERNMFILHKVNIKIIILAPWVGNEQIFTINNFVLNCYFMCRELGTI